MNGNWSLLIYLLFTLKCISSLLQNDNINIEICRYCKWFLCIYQYLSWNIITIELCTMMLLSKSNCSMEENNLINMKIVYIRLRVISSTAATYMHTWPRSTCRIRQLLRSVWNYYMTPLACKYGIHKDKAPGTGCTRTWCGGEIMMRGY